MSLPSHRVIVSVVLTLCCFGAMATAQEFSQKRSHQTLHHGDWNQWRGPNRDGVIRSIEPWPDSIDDKHLVEQWRVKLGSSYSGPVVSKNLVFTTETRNKETEVVTAYDRLTGKQIWQHSWVGSLTVPFFAKANGSWIRSTPIYDGANLYVAGIRDVLVCLDAETGQEKWRVDFPKKFKTPVPSFGFVCSPMIHGDHLYVQAGGGFCKLNKENGEVLWRSLVDNGGMYGSAFSSPIMVELSGVNQLLVQTREKLTGVSPTTGEALWEHKIPAFRGMNILTPTVYKDSVFTSAYGGNSLMFKVSAQSMTVKAEKAWTNPVSAYMSSPVVIDGHLYMHLRNQRFTCIDLESGESKWTTKPYGKYWSLIANGRKILALDERGDLLLINANPEKFELVEKRKISDSPTWAHVAFSNGQVFVRELNALVAYSWRNP